MRNIKATAALTVLVLSIAPGLAREKITAPWERGETRSRGAVVAPRPATSPPAALRHAVSVAAADADAVEHSARARSGVDRELVRRLIADARRAAERQVSGPGVENYFRVGFYRGMQDALNDAHLGRRDFRLGLSDGRSDREARRFGRQLGSDAAAELGALDAENAVAAQFRDLRNEPVFSPASDRSAWSAPPIGFDQPELSALFAEYPLAAFDRFGGEVDLYLSGWGWDAQRLYSCPGYSDFYDAEWSAARRAFRRWTRRPNQAGLVARLSEDQLRELRGLFATAFTRRIDQLTERRLIPAWELGLDRGWEYGRFIREEFDYRSGFAEGFRHEASRVAEELFRIAYPREFQSAYASAFDRWANSAVPEIGEIRLLDANDDGVFEPGERVLADVELINFGGAAGRITTRLTGPALSTIDSRTVEIPRRSSEIRPELLTVTIDGDLRPRSQADLELRVGDEMRAISLQVRRPLEWVPGSLRLARDNLAGRVGLTLDVRNISRTPRHADATLTTSTLDETSISRTLPEVRSQGSASVRFDVEGLSPFDLIAGEVTLDLFLDSAGTEQDRFGADLAGTATDLSSSDLSRLVTRLADRGATIDETARVRDLMLQRLRVDWRAAVRARGNPYKRDYRSRGERTALGELVQLSAGLSQAPEGGALLAGISTDVLTLAADLPGPHPLLRKYAKRLARRLP